MYKYSLISSLPVKQILDDRRKINPAFYVIVSLVTVFTISIALLLWIVFAIFCSILTTYFELPGCSNSLQLAAHTGCNQNTELCGRTYNGVVYATMHNAYATTQDGFIFAQHRACMRTALITGVRAFMLDVHLTSSGELKLCHVLCSLGSSSLQKTLRIFEEFLRNNPREIVTIMWEFGVDGRETVTSVDKLLLKKLLGQNMQSTGLYPYLHVQAPNEMWPVLEDMITNGKRLVSFSDTRTTQDEPWDLFLWQHAFETRYDSKSRKELEQSCVPNRGLAGNTLFIINHFTVVAAVGFNLQNTEFISHLTGLDVLTPINKEPYMWNRISACSQCIGRLPNFVVVDFWASSGVIEVVAKLNSKLLPSNASKCIV